MKTKILIGIIVLVILVGGWVALRPMYSNWKDVQVVTELQSKVIPFLTQKNISYFVDDSDCRQIKYTNREAASPKGCAYIPNQTDESKKDISDFTTEDERIFTEFKNSLSEISSKKIVNIGLEYPTLRPEHASLPHTSLGVAFNIDCAFCRTRYVYSPNYQKLPPDIEYEIWYTPINKDWYRVDQDWN